LSRHPYRVLDHTADTGIETEAGSLEAVIANAAFAMFDLMYELRDAGPGAPVEVEVDLAPPPDLLVSVLGELLYRSEADDVAFTGVAVRRDGERLVVDAKAVPSGSLELSGPPIKAITYHDLRCEEDEDGWHAQVIFDV
jgi:protein archease